MANKPTKRERREMAKRQKLEAQRNAVRRRRRRTIQSVVIFVVIGALVGGGIWWAGKSSREKTAKERAAKAKIEQSLNTDATAVGCGAVSKPSNTGREHIEPPALGTYSSNPPTSGAHYNKGAPNGPAFTGMNPAPIPNEIQAHNMEHGHVGIQYNATKIPAQIGAALQTFTQAHSDWVFMAPREANAEPKPGFTATIAFTGWEHIVTCGSGMKDDPAGFTKLATAFYDAYHNTGPEHLPGQPAPTGS